MKEEFDTLKIDFSTRGRRMDEMIDFMIEKDLHFDAIVTSRVPLVGAPEAVAEFDKGAVGKFVIEFE